MRLISDEEADRVLDMVDDKTKKELLRYAVRSWFTWVEFNEEAVNLLIKMARDSLKK